jgi:hypothetical protein
MSAPQLQTAFDAASMALVAMAVRQLAHQERQDPEVAGLSISVFADGAVDVQLLNGQGMPVGGYSL